MKKVVLSLLALSTVAFVACGPGKTFVAVDNATKTAMADLDTVTCASSIATIATSWTTACADATTATGAAEGEEATKIADLGAALQAKITTKSDSLTQILIQQMVLDTMTVVEPEATTKK